VVEGVELGRIEEEKR